MLPLDRVSAPSVLPSSVIDVPGTPRVPPFRLVSVPPWMETLFTNCTDELAPLTTIVPPALSMTDVLSARMPPLLASVVPPVLVNPPVGFTVSVCPGTLASIAPPEALASVRPPFPITPYPWIVISLVSVKLPPVSWM